MIDVTLFCEFKDHVAKPVLSSGEDNPLIY